MSFVYANNSVSHLSNDLSSGATFLLVATGEGDLFPQPGAGEEFPVTVEDRLAGTREIMLCTSRSGDQMFVTRGQEGTQAQSWLAGTLTSHRVTAQTLKNFDDANETNATNLEALTATVAALQNQVNMAQVAVGDLYMSAIADNPAARLGYGTWVAHGIGRALVSVGNNGTSQWNLGDERGAETHTLTEAQLASHDHTDSFSVSIGTDNAPNHQHFGSLWASAAGTGGFQDVDVQTTGGSSSRREANTPAGGARSHSHTASVGGKVNNAGSGQAHNNIQPSIAIHVWKRTA